MRVTIIEYKKLKNIDLTLNKFTVLIGQNHTGKSTFLEYLSHQFKNAKYFDNIPDFPPINPSKDPKVIQSLLSLIKTVTPNTLLLLRNPEKGIHPKLHGQIVEILKTAPSTTVISTYSPYLLDHVNIEDVLIFHRENEDIKITPMRKVKGIEDYLGEYLLGELWFNWGEEELIRRSTLQLS